MTISTQTLRNLTIFSSYGAQLNFLGAFQIPLRLLILDIGKIYNFEEVSASPFGVPAPIFGGDIGGGQRVLIKLMFFLFQTM